jgi:hypothetical protein
MPKNTSIVPATEPRKLPTLNDLYSEETLDALETSAGLTVLLNSEPNPKWIKVQDGIPHIPIDRVKWLLSRIFAEWQWEVRNSMQLWNGVAVAGRIHYKHPSGEWRFTDGVGAAPIQFKKDQPPIPENLNQKSIQKAYPSAESFALKNAAKKLGKLFGARLTGRDEEMDYDAVLGRFDSLPISEEDLAALESEIDSSKINRVALLKFLRINYQVETLSDLPRNLLQTVKMRITSANNHDGNS